MHSTDDTNPLPEKKARWKKCPICWDSVYVTDTRPVRWFAGQEGEAPREGHDVVLRLIIRQPGSNLALPRDGAEVLSEAEFIPWYHAAEVMDYAHIMKGSESYMLSEFDREIEELERQEKEDELMFAEESQWTKRAVKMIVDTKEKVKGIGNPPRAPEKPDDGKQNRLPIKFHESSDQVPDFYNYIHAAESGRSIWSGSSTPHHLELIDGNSTLPTGAIPNPAPRAQSNRTSKPPLLARANHYLASEVTFYFYQALLHYYLSPLDIRILKTAFGDYASFPSTILPRIERVSTGHIVDDDLRKRAKYLAHLPHGCEVAFLECDWTDTVVPEVLEGFSPEIERRRKRNKEKEAREEKERLRAEKDEDEKRWAASRRRRPGFSKDVDETHELAMPFQPDLSSLSSSPPWQSSQGRTGSSFASLASPSTSPAAATPTWPRPKVLSESSPGEDTPGEDSTPSYNDGWLQGWDYDEEDIVSQMQATAVEGESFSVGKMSGGGKKKKNKKITLMTTNARRAA
ncbi:MAG: hypothetical protein MMC33_000692 [Icmadophila ericetorum]|nr:hypothetical protein [Icmadophila ericetorum]